MSEINMRFIARCYIGNKKVDLSQHWIVLQSNIPGTAEIVINAEANKNSIVAIDLGWGDSIDRVFFGYVERVQQSAKGFYKLFCRELSAVLNNKIIVNLRHPTLRQVLDEVAKITGLTFRVPAKNYTKTAIPCFYSEGSGYALLDNLGRCYEIPDFIWQQQGNGEIYVGSYADSYWSDKTITIPDELLTKQSTGNSAKITVVPKLRPNVTANDRRIQAIEIKNTDMVITWGDK